MGAPGSVEERLLQAERLTEQAGWDQQRIHELNAGNQQYLEDWIGFSPDAAGAGCDPSLTETVNLPSGAPDVGATVTVKDHGTGIVLGTGTTGAGGVVVLGPGIGLGNATVDVVATDSRGCFTSPTHTIAFLCVDLADTIDLAPLPAGNVVVTIKSCTVAGVLAAGVTVVLDDPAGGLAGTVTADGFGVATFTGVVGPKGSWTAHITGPNLSASVALNVTSCGTNSFTVVVAETDDTYCITVEACGIPFGVTPCPAGQPGLTVDIKDSTGAVIGSGTTDSTGNVCIAVPAASSTPLTADIYSADFNVTTITLTGNVSYSWDSAKGCVLTYGGTPTPAIKANHFCFGGVQPPGYTGVVPATVTATFPNDPALDGGIRNAAFTCNLVSVTGTIATWESACVANPGNAFWPWIKAVVTMPASSCGGNLAGNLTATRYAANTCAGSTGGSAFNATSPAGVIWNPVSFGGTYVAGGVTYTWSVVE